MMESGQIDFTISRIEKIAEFLKIDFLQLIPSQNQILNVNGNQSSGSFYGTHNHTIPSEILTAIVDEISKKMNKSSS